MILSDPTVEGLRAALDAAELSPEEILRVCRERAEQSAPRLAAFNRLEPAAAGPAAAGGPLSGIPYALKENIAVRGRPLTCNSRILEGYRPPYDATVVERLRDAGAVLLGQTNMDEFGMGSSTEHSAAGPSRNPWDPSRTPGGSSGGSAAAVAAGIVPFALGTDTGGSIRQPAAFCGVVGLKPTYGRVSRYGLVAFASSLDQIGPMTLTVRDAALVYGVLAGHDPRDSTSLEAPVGDPVTGIEAGPAGLRIGVPRHLWASGVDPEVRDNLESILGRLATGGAQILDVELPSAGQAIAAYYVVATAEASSNLARYDGVRYGRRAEALDLRGLYRRTRSEGFGGEVKLRILLGTYVLSEGYYDAYYGKACQVRTILRREFEAALAGCDVLAMPTAPTPAFRLGERIEDPLQMYLSDVYTVSANLTGQPAIAVPSGLTASGLPLSVQLLAPALGEATLLRAARAVEMVADFASLRRDRLPSLLGGD